MEINNDNLEKQYQISLLCFLREFMSYQIFVPYTFNLFAYLLDNYKQKNITNILKMHFFVDTFVISHNFIYLICKYFRFIMIIL